MNKYTPHLLILLLVIIISCAIPTPVIGEEKQRPNAAERAMGFIDPANGWDKLKSWVKLAWISYGPEKTETGGDSMKEAVTKSFVTTKETAEHAAKAAGEAVHNTAEKVKRSVSGRNEEEGQEL